MNTLERIRERIRRRYEADPLVHLNVSLAHPKLELRGVPAVIKDVYPHVFRIEETSSGVPQCHTLQYTDVYTGHVEILELQN